jgi:hypothetical protein
MTDSISDLRQEMVRCIHAQDSQIHANPHRQKRGIVARERCRILDPDPWSNNMRAVVYARYSSDLQRQASIEDQIRLCRRRIEQESWQYLHAYTDRAVSGASALHPAYQSLLEDARQDQFDIVVAEALDRLSRQLRR